MSIDDTRFKLFPLTFTALAACGADVHIPSEDREEGSSTVSIGTQASATSVPDEPPSIECAYPHFYITNAAAAASQRALEAYQHLVGPTIRAATGMRRGSVITTTIV